MKDIVKRMWGLAVIGAVIGFVATGLSLKREAQNDQPANPAQFSLKDWKQALRVIKSALGTKNLPILAAGVAYFSTLAFFPLMAAVVAIAALVIAPEQLQHVVTAVDTYLPKDVANLVSTQLQNLSGKHADNLLAAVIAIAVSLFSASGASKSLVTAANTAYEVTEARGWLKQQLEGIGWTAAGVAFGFVVALVLIINKTIVHTIGIVSPFDQIILYGRWILMVVIITLGLAVFYRYGPNRRNPYWQWISWGALTATILWLIGTALFFIYVQNFGHYGRSYSFFAGIIILMIWLNLSAFIVLLGAAINHGMEIAARSE